MEKHHCGHGQFISNGVDQNLLCPFAACVKFNVDIIKNCSMHCLNLSLAFTANGACLKLLLDLGYFGDPNVELKFRLNNAFDDFQTFCKLSKISCSQRRFRVKHVMKESHGPYLTTKAFNARCIVAWLASCFLDAFCFACHRNQPPGKILFPYRKKWKMFDALTDIERILYVCG